MKFEMMPCAEEDAEVIEEQADKLSDAIAPPEEGAEDEQYVYKVTDEAGNILGGCVLNIDNWKSAAINDMWVDEAYRRRGIASALIRTAERKARERGCFLAMIGTFDFQARPLYLKHGYTQSGTTLDFPKGHRMYLTQKFL